MCANCQTYDYGTRIDTANGVKRIRVGIYINILFDLRNTNWCAPSLLPQQQTHIILYSTAAPCRTYIRRARPPSVPIMYCNILGALRRAAVSELYWFGVFYDNVLIKYIKIILNHWNVVTTPCVLLQLPDAMVEFNNLSNEDSHRSVSNGTFAVH